jgi:hypothetical protein
MKFRFYIPLLFLLFMTDMLWAQDFTLKVWSGNTPGPIQEKTYQEVKEYVNNGTSLRISKVTEPELLFYLQKCSFIRMADMVMDCCW